MTPDTRALRALTRRHFFANSGFSLGSLGLASILAGNRSNLLADESALTKSNPLHPRQVHFPARAKRVIYLFMAGGPSQLELFDNKPKLQEMEGQVIPNSYVKDKQFAFLKKDAKLLGTRRVFRHWGESG